MTVQSLRRRDDGKHALVVRGGWDGHVPVPTSDKYAAVLKDDGTTSRYPTPWTATSTRSCWPAPI